MAPVINPDFSEEVKPLGPGKHLVRVSSYQLKTGQQHGTKYVNWKLETVGEQKAVIYHSTPVEGKGSGLFKQFVQATIDPLYENGPVDADSIVGTTLVVDSFKDAQTGYLKVKGVERSDQQADLGSFTEDNIPF